MGDLTMTQHKHRVLVTGGAGFIGSHVVIHLVKRYPHYKIVNLDKLDYCASLHNLKDVEGYPNYRFVKGNVLDADAVTKLLREENIDTIIHLAAQTHVDNSFGNSLEFTLNNTLGTHTLLEAVKSYGVISRFIHASTDEVYGDKDPSHDDSFDDESSHLEPTNPYAATKAGAEFLVKAYHKSFHLPAIITRCNNVYGPHQYPEKLIPKFACLIDRGLNLPVHGDGSHSRHYIYATDVAEAYDVLLHKGQIGEVYNIAGDVEMSNAAVATRMLEQVGLGGEAEKHIDYVEDRCFNDRRYLITDNRMSDLGWHPRTPFDEGIAATMEWYKNRSVEHWADIDKAIVPHPRMLPMTTRIDPAMLAQ